MRKPLPTNIQPDLDVSFVRRLLHRRPWLPRMPKPVTAPADASLTLSSQEEWFVRRQRPAECLIDLTGTRVTNPPQVRGPASDELQIRPHSLGRRASPAHLRN